MAFTVEDGTGVENANAITTVEFCDDYHADRGNTDWTGSAAAKQVAIVKATDYMERAFGQRTKGTREFWDIDGLLWPRVDVYDRDGRYIEDVPVKWQMACAEYALRVMQGVDLLPDVINDSITAESKKVGPIEVSTSYGAGGEPDAPEFPEVEAIIADFLFVRSGRAHR